MQTSPLDAAMGILYILGDYSSLEHVEHAVDEHLVGVGHSIVDDSLFGVVGYHVLQWRETVALRRELRVNILHILLHMSEKESV